MGHRILVVDDDRNIGQILHASFSAKGYEVYISRNGEDALEQLEELRPDLVLLDVLLPKMNGWDVCRQIKSRENGTPPPVILMSAVYKTPKMQLEAKQKYGADEFVEKPFQLSSLMDMTVRLIGEPDAVAEAAPSAPADDAAAPAEEPAGGEAVVDDERVELEGTLDDVPFPELLHTLYVMGRPGRLEMTSDGKEKTISVMDGYPVSVRTNIDDELFGNYLVRQHVITAEQCAEAVKKMEASGRLLGTVLIEMDLLSPQQVVNYLRMQVRDKLFEIFSWPSGTYRFIEDRSVTGDLQNVEMSVANIINEGVRRHYPYGRVSALVKDLKDQYVRLGTDSRFRYQDLELTPTEAKLLENIDGTQSFGQIQSESPLPTERTLQILYTLVVSGIVEMVEGSEETPQSRVFSTDDFSSEFEDAGAEAAAPEPAAQPTPAAPEPAPEAPPPAAEDDVKLRKRVLHAYEKLSSDDLFDLLGVSDNPTEHDVRIAYHRLAKDFHPDRFFGRASAEVKAKVEEIFRAINEAYDRLNTQEKIIAYKKKRAGEKPEDETPDERIQGVKRVILAEQRYQQGLQFIKDKRFTRAAHAFKEALDVVPNEPEYISYYGWALYNIPFEKDADEEELALRPKESMADIQFEARESINRAISVNPKTEKAYVFLGRIYKQQGMIEFAEKQYEKALICNPNSIEALRELRLIKLQEQQTQQKKKSFFDKLLKR